VHPEYKARAMHLLWAGGVLVGREIGVLLHGGYGGGALARWRTLHEMQVVSTVLFHGNDETAARFMDREDLRHAQALVNWHRASKAHPDISKLDRNVVGDAQRSVDTILGRYEPVFRGDFGWAHDLVYDVDDAYRKRWDRGNRPSGPRFEDLQRVTGLGVFGPDYAFASLTIHASPVLATRAYLPLEQQGSRVGPALDGLKIAGNNAAQAIADIATAFALTYPDPPDSDFEAGADRIGRFAGWVAAQFRALDERLRE
jgi:hypothetical protein